jgi:hypothetical protein
LAASIKQSFGITAEIVPGSKGIFLVEADGKKLFDKYDAGRFPDEGEVEENLHELIDNHPSP